MRARWVALGAVVSAELAVVGGAQLRRDRVVPSGAGALGYQQLDAARLEIGYEVRAPAGRRRIDTLGCIGSG